jgi:hypothetical protein
MTWVENLTSGRDQIRAILVCAALRIENWCQVGGVLGAQITGPPHRFELKLTALVERGGLEGKLLEKDGKPAPRKDLPGTIT